MGQGKLGEVILRNTRALQPAANTVADGTWYYVTDENVTERSDGSAWQDCSDAGSGGITQLTGDVTAGPGTGSQAATIANDAVTFAKMQNIATDRLLGRDTAASGNTEEIPVSSGIEFTGGPGLRVTAAVRTQQIGITIDGGGSPITAGAKGFKSFPVAGTITGVRLLADVAGNVVFDILKSTYSGFPTQATIVASAPPTLSGVQKNEDTTLTGWTTAVAAGDVFGFEVEASPTPTVERVTLELTIVVT
jgi:hypothetical protein